jgi:hypothetical protein
MFTACKQPQYLDEYTQNPGDLLTSEMVYPYTNKAENINKNTSFVMPEESDRLTCQYYWRGTFDSAFNKKPYVYLGLGIGKNKGNQTPQQVLKVKAIQQIKSLGDDAYWYFNEKQSTLYLVVMYGSHHFILSLTRVKPTVAQSKIVAIQLARQILQKCKKR